MPFLENSASDTRRAAAGEREFFPDGKMREALEKKFLGYAANFRGRRRKQTNLHKIKQKKLAEQGQGYAMGRSRMAREAQTHAFIFFPRRMRSNRAEERRGKIEAFEQNANVAFGEAGVCEGGDEDFLGGIVKKCAQGVAGSGARLGDASGEFRLHGRRHP